MIRQVVNNWFDTSQTPITLKIKYGKAMLIFACFGLSYAFRLFFLETNLFYVDGDEAIIGLMGIDVLDGKVNLYFLGQNYGLSVLESLLVALGITVFDTTALAIKLPMILLWSSALTLLILSCYRITNKSLLICLVLTLVMVSMPAWTLWSMKARGGYLTALFFNNLVMYFIVANKGELRHGAWCLIGVMVTIVYEAQALWFPVTVLSVVVIPAYLDCDMKGLLTRYAVAFTSSVIVWVCLATYKSDLFVVWEAPLLNLSHIVDNPEGIVTSFHNHLNGLYYLHRSFDQSITGHIFLTWLVTISVILFCAFDISRGNLKKSSIVLLLPASLAGALINPNPRYLLPFSFILFFIFVLGVARMNPKYQISACIFMLILTASYFSYSSNYFKYSQMKVDNFDELEEPITITDNQIIANLIDTLNEKGIEHAITRNDFLEYQINYFTRYELLSIGKISRTRVPKIVPSIEKAYRQYPERFAIVGYNWSYSLSKYYPSVNGKLIYWTNPDPRALRRLDLLPVRN